MFYLSHSVVRQFVGFLKTSRTCRKEKWTQNMHQVEQEEWCVCGGVYSSVVVRPIRTYVPSGNLKYELIERTHSVLQRLVRSERLMAGIQFAK